MRPKRRVLGAIGGVIVSLAALVPSGAQPATQVVRDPKGRFTIRVPQGWNVTAMDISGVSLSGQARRLLDRSSTMLFATPTVRGRDVPLPMFWLMTMKKPDQFSPNLFADFGKVRPPAVNPYSGIFGGYDFTVVQTGRATIAGHPGSYAYVTVTPHPLSAPPSGAAFPPSRDVRRLRVARSGPHGRVRGGDEPERPGQGAGGLRDRVADPRNAQDHPARLHRPA